MRLAGATPLPPEGVIPRRRRGRDVVIRPFSQTSFPVRGAPVVTIPQVVRQPAVRALQAGADVVGVSQVPRTPCAPDFDVPPLSLRIFGYTWENLTTIRAGRRKDDEDGVDGGRAHRCLRQWVQYGCALHPVQTKLPGGTPFGSAKGPMGGAPWRRAAQAVRPPVARRSAPKTT